MRRELAEAARRFGVDEERIPDLVLAVNEIATNSILYTGKGSLGLWQTNGRLVCEVRDLGYIEDPLVGRRRPKTTEERGTRDLVCPSGRRPDPNAQSPSGTTVRILFDCVSGS